MGERHDPEQLNAEDWGHAVATSEFDHDVPEEREELTIERIEEMINEHQFKELKEELKNNMYPVDLAEILREVDEKWLVLIFRLLEKEEAAETFSYMDSDQREILINALTDSELEEVMEEMYLDDTVDVLEEMPANVVDRLLLATDEETRAQINQLLQYPEDSAGSVMNVDYIALRKEMTVAESILKIRQVGINKETIYTCFVTDAQRRLEGVVTIKDLLMNPYEMKIQDIMDENVIKAVTTEDQEEVVDLFNKYDLMCLPVVDHEDRLVGIVTVDDVVDVMEEEATEDIEKMAAMLPSDKPYLKTGILELARNRIVWLTVLMLSSMITGSILTHYETAFAALPLLVSFVPMLTGTGGNAGSQSSTTVIRAMTIGDVEPKDILKIVWKEIRVAVVVGIILASLNFIRLMVQYPGETMVCITVVVSLVVTIILAKTIGCTLPILAQILHLDPAIMAAPLISTIVDACSLIVYFQIACRLLAI